MSNPIPCLTRRAALRGAAHFFSLPSGTFLENVRVN